MRDAMRGTLTTLAVTGAAGGGVRPAAPLPGKGVIQLSEILNPGETARFRLAKQIGINHAIVSVNGALSKVHRSEYVATLTKIKHEMEASGLKMAGVESHPVPAEKIKLGLDGRDEEIENYKAAIDALAKIGVNMVCYNFMAGLGWYRTKVNVPETRRRLTSEFDVRTMSQGCPMGRGQPGAGLVNLEYFPERGDSGGRAGHINIAPSG